MHLPTPPVHIRTITDHVYFYLDRKSGLWPEFSTAGSIGMHFSGDWPELQLELLVNLLRATDKPNARHTIPPGVQSLFGGFCYGWVLRQSQVIVCTQVQHGFAIGDPNHGSLRRRDDSLLLESAAIPNRLELALKVFPESVLHEQLSELCNSYRSVIVIHVRPCAGSTTSTLAE